MWSAEDGWCRWDSNKQDYVPTLNVKKIEGASPLLNGNPS